jgi:prepilin-type N-terminal cleavage/methylation domain-containing protein
LLLKKETGKEQISMMKAIRNTKGFSLLELMVTLAILSVGLLGLLGMQITGAQGNATSQKITIATTLAQTGIEDFMSRSAGDAIFDTAVGSDDGNPANDPTYDLDLFTAATTLSHLGITYSATFIIIPSTPVVGVSRVDVTVTGGGRAVTFTTFKRTV